MSQCLGKVDTGDSIKGGRQCLHVRLLGARLARSLIQDVPTVEDEEKCVDPAHLLRALCRATLQEREQSSHGARQEGVA